MTPLPVPCGCPRKLPAGQDLPMTSLSEPRGRMLLWVLNWPDWAPPVGSEAVRRLPRSGD